LRVHIRDKEQALTLMGAYKVIRFDVYGVIEISARLR
jgi:hypothetical protein